MKSSFKDSKKLCPQIWELVINSFSYMVAGMPTFISTIFPHDDGEGADNLLGHWSRHGSTVGGSVGVLPQVVDDFLCGTCMCVCVCVIINKSYASVIL